MSGHVFVTQCDLTKLHCDAWLLPTDASLSVTRPFRDAASPLLRERLARLDKLCLPEGWGDDGARVVPVPDRPAAPVRPRPYLVNVGGLQRTPVDWYMEGVRQFCDTVARQQPLTPRVTERLRPLVGLPFVGARRGGGRAIKGDIVRALLDTLDEKARTHDLDFVLVTRPAQAHAAAQNARLQQLGPEGESGLPGPWPELAPALRQTARTLARHATAGKLVLFIGAGVGVGAGLPAWGDLLKGLADDARMDKREREALARLNVLDQARIVEKRLVAHGRELRVAVRDRISAVGHVSLAHSLLAALPVTEVVTTNYDCLFELASQGAGHSTAVLPYQSVSGHDRWLLKLHGSVTHPHDIVLTREDYMRYADSRAALAGIVQSLLITRHMLFVGFSLTDDNFQLIVDDVHKAIWGSDHPATPAAPFGTALLLHRDPLLEELWRVDLDLVSMDQGDGAALAGEARMLEIFLDYLLAEATRGTTPLLDASFEGVLTADERAVRDLLHELQTKVPGPLRHSPAWQPVARLLERLGEPHSSTQT